MVGLASGGNAIGRPKSQMAFTTLHSERGCRSFWVLTLIVQDDTLTYIALKGRAEALERYQVVPEPYLIRHRHHHRDHLC